MFLPPRVAPAREVGSKEEGTSAPQSHQGLPSFWYSSSVFFSPTLKPGVLSAVTSSAMLGSLYPEAFAETIWRSRGACALFWSITEVITARSINILIRSWLAVSSPASLTGVALALAPPRSRE